MFLMPGVWINSLASQIYIFLISGFFGVATLGAVSLSQTAIILPTSLVSIAFAEVFRQRAIEELQTTGTCRPLLLKTIRKLFLISIVPFALFFFLAPMLFAIVFGKQWYLAGTYAQLLTVNNMVRFILAPVSGVVIQLSERLEVDIVWQLTFLAANFSTVYFGNMFFHDIRMVLILYSIADIGLYFFAFYFAYRFSQKRPPGMKGGSIDAYAGIA
jgi:O-antigen/teichoic acid export membrane protein